MDILRVTPVPALYTCLPFVRRSAEILFADTADDMGILRGLQRVASRLACPSTLEASHQLIVGVRLPEHVLSLSGASGTAVAWRTLHWKLWDAECFVTGERPAEAVAWVDAVGSEHDLRSLAAPRSCLPLLRQAEKLFGGGYRLDPSVADQIADEERRLFASMNLEHMKANIAGRAPRRTPASRSPKASRKIRDAVLRRDMYRCFFCGRGTPAVELEVNHIVPRSLVRKLQLPESLHTDPANLCVTCVDCNRGKSDVIHREDSAFYLAAFAESRHPNHGIVPFLETIAAVQSLGSDDGGLE